MKTEQILAERGNRYGAYADNARVMQRIKDALRSGSSWEDAPDTVKEALECVALKLGRIVNGDPLYDDNYKDAIGYLTLALEAITPPTTVDPTIPGPAGTEPQGISHCMGWGAEGLHIRPAGKLVPRADGLHLTQDHVGMYFRLANGENGRLVVNDGPENLRFPFKVSGRRYTEYGFCAAADGDPIRDIVGVHPH